MLYIGDIPGLRGEPAISQLPQQPALHFPIHIHRPAPLLMLPAPPPPIPQAPAPPVVAPRPPIPQPGQSKRQPIPFAEVYGPSALVTVRTQLGHRASLVTGFSALEYRQLQIPLDALCRIVQLLAPDPVLPVPFSQATLGGIFHVMCANGSPAASWLLRDLVELLVAPQALDGAQILELVNALDTGPNGLTPQNSVVLIRRLGEGVGCIDPAQIHGLTTQLCTGATRTDPAALMALVQVLMNGGAAITATRVHALLMSLTGAANPITATQAEQLLTTYTVGPNTLDPTQIDTLITWLRTAPGALRATSVRVLLTTLVTANQPITCLQCEALLTALHTGATGLNGVQIRDLVVQRLHETTDARWLTSSEVRTLLTQLLNGNHLNPAQIDALTNEGTAHVRIRPRFLLQLAQNLAPSFPQIVNATQNPAQLITMVQLIDIISDADTAGMNAAQCCTLVNRIPHVGHSNSDPRTRRVRSFISMCKAAVDVGPTSWLNIFTWLRDFLLYWNVNNSFNDTGQFFSSAAYPLVTLAAGLHISGGRINYVCNAHSYRYHDFGIVDRAGEAGSITFFAANADRNAIEADIVGFYAANRIAIDALADEAWHANDYRARIIGIVEVGCTRRGADVYITHYVPGGNRIPVRILKAFWKLFR
jgi:hypothetical protein